LKLFLVDVSHDVYQLVSIRFIFYYIG